MTHANCITRRGFIGCALAGAVGAGWVRAPRGAWADGPVRLLLAADFHYLTPRLFEEKGFLDGSAYEGAIMTRCLDPIIDALADDVIAQRPDAFLCLGDLVFDGETPSHEDLVEKFARIQDAGIPVLVIPGNHDINSRSTDGSRTSAQSFARFYNAFGRDRAHTCDDASLSYEWRLRDDLRLLMVDCNAVEEPGVLPAETLAWIEERLARAQADGAHVVSCSHQVLWPSVYNGIAIENSAQVLDLYERYGVKLNLSGHVHVQAITQPSPSVTDVTTMALGIAPVCYAQVGIDAGQATYDVRLLDVEGWAHATGQVDPNLLGFRAFAAAYAHDLHYQTALSILAGAGLEGPEAEELAGYAAQLNRARYDGERAGVGFDPDLAARWLEIVPETARRYGYDIDPSTVPDQTHALVAL